MENLKFINSNIKLKGIQNRPKAKKCGISEMKKAMLYAAYKMGGGEGFSGMVKKVDDYSEIFLIDSIYQNASRTFPQAFVLQEDWTGILPDCSLLTSDYLFGEENTIYGDVSQAATGVIGWHYMKNCAPFYGFFLNDPIALPVVACMYLGQDNQFHTFIPFYGNTINADFATSIGNEFDSEFYEEICEKYKGKRILPEDFSFSNYSDSYKVTDAYFEKYGFRDITHVRVSWDAMRADIEETLCF